MPVTIFEHANFQGRSQELTEGQYDNQVGQISIGNDTLSSLKVSPGLVARLYEHSLFRGEFIEFKTDTPAVPLPWNDRASSIVVYQDGQEPSIKPYGPIVGINSFDAGPGVYGESTGSAVWGNSKAWVGVFGETQSTTGGVGVWGQHNQGGSAVFGFSPSGIGIHGKGGRLAGLFEGNVEITEEVRCNQGLTVLQQGTTRRTFFSGSELFVLENDSLRLTLAPNGLFFHHPAGHNTVEIDAVNGDIILGNADCAEDFNISTDSAVDPGTVMALDEEGSLLPSQRAYDKRVAGVVSGAGSYKPGIVLDKQQSVGLRQPIALLGKVYCKVDAQYGAIEVGDLLTTSPTLGHAMKADDPLKAFGAVIGKALRPCRAGVGLIPILVALQ
jgi:hypothetical protein